MTTTTRAPRSTVTPEVIAEIRRLRLVEKMTINEVSARLGIGKTTVLAYSASGPRSDPERDARIVALLREGKTQIDIVNSTGITPKIVSDTYRWASANGLLDPTPATDATYQPTSVRLGSAPTPATPVEVVSGAVVVTDTQSLKVRLLRAIAEAGPFADTTALMAAVRRPDDSFDLHEVQHLLHSLNKQGAISYRENRNGAYRMLTRIEATKRGFAVVGLARTYHEVGRNKGKGVPRKTGDRTDFRTHGFRAEAGPVEVRKVADIPLAVEAKVAAVAVTEATVVVRGLPPLLSALRERARQKAEGAEKAARYLEAAALLEAVDVKEANRLLALAESSGGEPFTPLESEYLAFAEGVERRDK